MGDNTKERAPAADADGTKETSVRKKRTRRPTTTSSRRDPESRSSMSGSASRGKVRTTAAEGDDNKSSAENPPSSSRRSKSTDRKARRESGGRKERASNSETTTNAESAATSERERRRHAKGLGTVGGGSGMGSSSGRHHSPTPGSRIRKTKSDGVSSTISRGDNATSSGATARDRSKSPNKSLSQRVPHRATTTENGTTSTNTISSNNNNNSKLHTALEKAMKHASAKKDMEEQSLGDFGKYSQQQQQLKSKLDLMEKNKAASNANYIPEESLGSFAAFAKRYEQEALMGLHDEPDKPDPYAPKPRNNKLSNNRREDVSMGMSGLLAPVQEYSQGGQEEMSASLGGLLNPMKQYGGLGYKPSSSIVEESLGSFAAFHKKYEDDKLMGFHDSADPPPRAKKREPDIPEESMDILELVGGDKSQEDDETDILPLQEVVEEEDKVHIMAQEPKTLKPLKSGSSTDVDSFYTKVPVLPLTRIQDLGIKGGVGYKIMVDTPGGHAPEPMKIVVAIEFEDESDSEDEKHEKQSNGKEERKSEIQENNTKEAENRTRGSAALPDTAVDPDQDQGNQKKERLPQGRRKKHSRKTDSAKVKARKEKPKNWHDNNTHDDDSEADDEVKPLGQPLSRWKQRQDGNSIRPPERSRSSHSSVSAASSVTMDSALVRGAAHIESDQPPTHHADFQRKPPTHGTRGSLRRSSGALVAGGTAALMRRPVAPHNLGTKRGLMLRQQSEASMMSTKSNDSSYTNSKHESPAEASFMQLNLLDLEQTQMQTNQEVEKAELPDALFSGVEGLSQNTPESLLQEELETIPEGKDPQAAASELLGMKTMLKHIKRVAPKRTKSFEFDKDMPKQMWNSLFARSKKGDLPGSEYVDRGSDSDENEPEVSAPYESDAAAKKESDRSASKGKSFLWSRIVPSISKDANREETGETITSPNGPNIDDTQDDNESRRDNDDEESIGIDDVAKDQAEEVADDEQANDCARDSGDRPKTDTKAGEGSLRGVRASYGRMADGARPTRTRANRAQHMNDRSLRDTLDYYTADQEGEEEGHQLGAINEGDEQTRRIRHRGRRKAPNRTKSEESTGRTPPLRGKPSDGPRLHRTRSHDGSSPRITRATLKSLHQSFSQVENADQPTRSDFPSRAIKSKRESTTGHHGEVHGRARSQEKGAKVSSRKARGVRRKPAEAKAEPESSGHLRGISLPEGATEEQLRELLDYH